MKFEVVKTRGGGATWGGYLGVVNEGNDDTPSPAGSYDAREENRNASEDGGAE